MDNHKTFQGKKTEKSISGGIDTGGGTLIHVKRGIFSSTQLIDLYNFTPYLNEPSFKKIRIPPSSLPNSCELTNSLSGGFLDRLFKYQIRSIMDPLTKSLRDENGFAGMNRNLVTEAMDKTEFIFSERRLGEAAVDHKAYLKENSDHIQRIPLAVYIQGQGTIVSLPDFNEMSGQDQVGLIVHEVLRQISIGFKLYLSDYDLQKITAQLMSRSKNNWPVNDDKEFLETNLPQEVYMGPFTKYVVRALLNDVCSFASLANPKFEEGSECQNLPTVDVNQIYSKIENIKNEITKAGAIDFTWPVQLYKAQERFYEKGKAYDTNQNLNKFLRQENECADFVQFLKQVNFLK